MTTSRPRRSSAAWPSSRRSRPAKVAAYERKNQNRSTVLSRVDSLQGDEPWPGYDELTADEVRAMIAEGDDDRAKRVRAYERAHKNRAGVLKATDRQAAVA